MRQTADEVKSPHVYARKLARRFEAVGANPYASDKKRYFVLLDGSGEVIESGLPLKNSRIFGPSALRKDIPVVEDFVDFAEKSGLKDCYFWSIKLTGTKAGCAELSAALTGFNNKINQHFSELRKHHGFEQLMLAIHPHFDEVTGLFDLHAHFICKVPKEHLEHVHIRLCTQFSISDLPRHPIRKPRAAAKYILFGIWRNKEMIKWPDHALAAAWDISEKGFRLARFGGSFKKFRAGLRVMANDNKREVVPLDKDVVALNRKESADSRMALYETGDRLLTKVTITRGEQRVAAFLYEVSPIKSSNTEHSENITVVGYNDDVRTQNSVAPVSNHEAEAAPVGIPMATKQAEAYNSTAARSAVTQEIVDIKIVSPISNFVISKFSHLKSKITQTVSAACRVWNACSRGLVSIPRVVTGKIRKIFS